MNYLQALEELENQKQAIIQKMIEDNEVKLEKILHKTKAALLDPIIVAGALMYANKITAEKREEDLQCLRDLAAQAGFRPSRKGIKLGPRKQKQPE